MTPGAARQNHGMSPDPAAEPPRAADHPTGGDGGGTPRTPSEGTPPEGTPPEGTPPERDPFDLLADTIVWPDRTATDTARALLGGAESAAHGRLADLACWWASVRADPRAAPPRRVLHLQVVPSRDEDRAHRDEDPTPRGQAPGSRDASPAHPSLPAYLAADRGVQHRTLVPPRSFDHVLEWAQDVVGSAVDAGVDLVLLSLPLSVGARAADAWLNRMDAVQTLGWPRGGEGTGRIDDASWAREVCALRDTLWRLRGAHTPTALLHRLDDPLTSAGTALLLGCAARRTPVLLEGFPAVTCAVLARRVCRPARGWWQVADAGQDPASERSLGLLDLPPVLRLGLHPGHGGGVLLGATVLDAACHLLETMP